MRNTDNSYFKEFIVSTSPERLFNAISKEIDKWWTELSNQTYQAGDLLTVQFEKTTSWVMEVVEFSLNKALAWNVISANHELDTIHKKDEWYGTTIKWKIEQYKTGSKILFIHDGLVPDLECYQICETGWDYFLGSLKNYLENGTGNPFKEQT